MGAGDDLDVDACAVAVHGGWRSLVPPSILLARPAAQRVEAVARRGCVDVAWF
eukprot:COSAG05_NODE_8029_length_744_cov_0.956589_1_plen_52_part_10